MEYEEIARIISEAEKKTPAIVYVRGEIDEDNAKQSGVKVFKSGDYILIGDWEKIKQVIKKTEEIHVELKGRYSALPLADLRRFHARIEPGAIIREGAEIGKDCIIMMGAVINIGAVVGEGTMVDMNAVIGARAIIGKYCHIGAGSVIAGVLEPPSARPVIIEDRVLIGANAVVLEAVRIGMGSIVAAGAVVIEDVPEGVVVAGIPAKVIKKADDVQEDKKSILKELRKR